jgi:hypothetical protein
MGWRQLASHRALQQWRGCSLHAQKRLLSQEPLAARVFAGSILYWNKSSHVALVTHGDGIIIKFAQHGATQSKDTVLRNQNVSFYLPSAAIMK